MPDQAGIYLDYSATTPLDPRVLGRMLRFFTDDFGNPSSTHRFGQRAESAVETARDEIATLLGCSPDELIFTSGGSESDNLALRGVALARRDVNRATLLLISPVEHLAVAATAAQLASEFGFSLETLPVDVFGQVDPQEVARRLTTDTALVSAIYANNEIGTINPISEIGRLCREQGIPFHTDALQAANYLDLQVAQLRVDLLSLGAHKFYGPKGVGLLYVRHGCPLVPVQTGGEQEGGLRGGTLNVPLIVGMAEALKVAREEMEKGMDDIRERRDRLIDFTLSEIPDSRLTGHPTERLPNHASFAFKDVDGNLLLNLLDVEGFACSSGSACKTGSPTPSGVLKAIGLDSDWALGSLRVTMGRWTTDSEVDQFCKVLPGVIERARKLRTMS